MGKNFGGILYLTLLALGLAWVASTAPASAGKGLAGQVATQLTRHEAGHLLESSRLHRAGADAAVGGAD